MALTASISINVPALPESDIWFANAAAWSNYWNDISGDVEFDPVVTQVYADSVFVDVGDYVMNVDGVEFRLVQKATFDSLKNRLDVLNDSYEQLRTELRNAGIITQAQ